MASPTSSQLAANMSALIDRWNTYTAQMKDWLAGTATGGPNGDGKYPLTNSLGVTFMVDCPAKQAATVETTVGSAGSHADAAAASAAAAAAAQTASETARDVTASYKDAAVSARDLAQTYANTSGSNAANSLASANSAATSASDASTSASDAATSASDAASSATAAATSATNAASSASAAAASATAAATFNPSNYYLKTEGDSRYRLVSVALQISDIVNLTTTLAGKQASLGFTPVQQGGGTGQGTNKVYIGWSGTRLKATVDATDLGNLVFDGHLTPYALLTGAQFTGSSSVQIGTNKKGIELSADSTNQFAYVDFHTSNTSFIDYDARLSATGSSNPTSGGATFNAQCAAFQINGNVAWHAGNLSIGTANGVAPLGSDSKISTTYLPAAVLGQVSYQGTWDATTGAPTATPSKGWYYVVTVAGSTNLSGITDWKVGDWAIYNGTTWDKVDNTDAISSWNGRTGAITPLANDYTFSMLGSLPTTLAGFGITDAVSTSTYTAGMAAKAPLDAPTFTNNVTASTGEIRAMYVNGVRMVQGNFGAFWRQDGASLWLLLTATGDQYGTYNALRPFSVNLTSGLLTSSNGQSFSGGTSVASGGLNFGSQVAASNSDLSKHIALYSTNTGFCITSGALNYVVGSGAKHSFIVNSVEMFRADGTDTYFKNANAATMTRQPRTFVQSTDPGAAAADGDLWIW